MKIRLTQTTTQACIDGLGLALERAIVINDNLVAGGKAMQRRLNESSDRNEELSSQNRALRNTSADAIDTVAKLRDQLEDAKSEIADGFSACMRAQSEIATLTQALRNQDNDHTAERNRMNDKIEIAFLSNFDWSRITTEGKIPAIRQMREMANGLGFTLGLKNAKDAIDMAVDRGQWTEHRVALDVMEEVAR